MKTITDTILERIHALRDEGKTQDAIARHFNVPQQTIGLILTGKRKVENLTLYTVQKMFPQAVICLDGLPPSGNTANSTNGVAALTVQGNVVNNQAGPTTAAPMPEIPAEIIAAVIADKSMSPTEKAELLKTLLKK